MKIRYLPVLAACALVSSCNPFASNPSADDLSRMFGMPVSNVSCVAADGKPGRLCSFMSGGDSFTRRIIKLDDGTWKPVAN
jgi:hypothetical protein